MKKLISFIFVSIICLAAIAKQIDENTAKTVGKNFLAALSDNANSAINLSLIYKAEEKNTLLNKNSANKYFYIFNCSGSKGFVIVSADDIVIPVLGYSLNNSFVAVDMPANLSWWLQNYCDQIQYAIENNLSTSEENKVEWKDLLSGKNKNFDAKSSLSLQSVSPLLQLLTWDQNTYYNDLCPGSPHAYTGCAATAMAQIMKFWNYPPTGTGYNSYTSANYGFLEADFGNTTYNWAAMLPHLTSFNFEVARLMFHCGVSVFMNYGIPPVGSGATPSAVKNAYSTYFGYNSSTIQLKSRSNYPNEADWIALLKNELDYARPIQYNGWGQSGHSWVCDGYDQSNFFHMNWGWGGTDNDYYSINSLVPAPTPNGTYNSNQMVIIGIEPPSGNCNYSLSQYNNNFSSNGGQGNINVYTSSNCSWTAVSSDNSWIHITLNSSGTGNQTVSYTVDANTTTNIKYGSITIAGYTYTISESGLNCSYTLSPSTSTPFSSNANQGSVYVSAPPSCSWTAISNDNSWIHINSGSSGTGNSTVNYTVDSNQSTSIRYSSITIAGYVYNITQYGLNCSYSISPAQSTTFPYLGGNGSFQINTNGSCAWTAVSNDPSWLHITSSPNGVGSSTITYSVDLNSGQNSLIGTISVAGQIYTVTESGNSINCTVTFIPSTFQPIGNYPGNYSIVYNLNSSCGYSALTSNPEWLNNIIASNNVVHFSVTENTGYFSRNGFISMNGTSIMITQAGNPTTNIGLLSKINSITVYPNPTTNEINIENNTDSEIQKIEIYNILGQKVLEENTSGKTVGNESFKINIQQLAAGSYNMQITTSKGVVSRQVAVDKNGK